MGQNGKGMTKEFAMASAYAEFFERFQNGLFRFRMEKPTKEIPFSNSPDEKRITVDELLKENNPIFKNILNQNGKGKCSENEQKEYLKTILNEKSNLVKQEEYISLPYYDVRQKILFIFQIDYLVIYMIQMECVQEIQQKRH